MRRQLLTIVLGISKAFGLFRLARRLTQSRLRILCYHGFALADETRFRASLFMQREEFVRRMRYLAEQRFPVVPLDEAVDQLEQGTLPPCATVITIDDGFHSVYRVALPILAERGFPAVLYLTTYYFCKGTPIYRLLISYLLWKAADGVTVDLSGLGVPALDGPSAIALTPDQKNRLYTILERHGESDCDEDGRQRLARALAERLGVDYRQIVDSRILSLINAEEARALERAGVRIELHTHRHRLPAAAGAARAEIEDNRRVLEPLLQRPLKHFCYPSGEWRAEHLDILAALDIDSATTCDSGLVARACPRLALPRILDDMRVSQLEFEAEMSGYMDLIRGLLGRSPARG